MNDTTTDLRDEYRQLADLCATLDESAWRRRSEFYGWTAWDEIAHLCFFDETGLKSATDAQAFKADTAALNAQLATGKEISAIAREKYGLLDGAALLAHWRPISEALVEALDALDPKARLLWYGPPMSARSFITARLMETWAHGQDVWDVVRERRPPTRRLKHIAHLGVTTYGWTFVNRGLPVPTPVPHVELTSPDKETWTWGDPDSSEFVRGTAEDFCLLVTQRRNLADLNLSYSEGSARQWLSMAQCFAGPPADAPAPGVRKVEYVDA